MCNERNCEGTSCFIDTIKTILKLQNHSDDDCCNLGGCDRPYLGPTPTVICFNTRPLNLYTCCNGTLWTLPYTYNGTTGTSSIFRAESLDGNCLTCRILIPSETPTDVSPYTMTDSYVTFDLSCVGVLKCLPDVYVPCN